MYAVNENGNYKIQNKLFIEQKEQEFHLMCDLRYGSPRTYSFYLVSKDKTLFVPCSPVRLAPLSIEHNPVTNCEDGGFRFLKESFQVTHTIG